MKADNPCLSHDDKLEFFPVLLGLSFDFSSSWRFYPLPVFFGRKHSQGSFELSNYELNASVVKVKMSANDQKLCQ